MQGTAAAKALHIQTKAPITNELDAIKALFEIDWAAEYAEDGADTYMKYWDKA